MLTELEPLKESVREREQEVKCNMLADVIQSKQRKVNSFPQVPGACLFFNTITQVEVVLCL